MNRFHARSFASVLTLAAFVAADAQAASQMRSQRLTPPETYATGFAQTTPAVCGDWMAAFGRLSDAAGDGRVYVFHRQAGDWSLYQELAPPDGTASQDALACAGETLIVGSPTAWDPQVGANSGAVSLYTLQGGQWMLDQIIYTCTGFQIAGTGFGSALAVDGTTLFVGFPGYVNKSNLQVGDVEAYSLSALPAAYVGQIVANNPMDFSNFGSSVAAANGMLAVGANNLGLAGVGSGAGAIYAFKKGIFGWTQIDLLTAPAAKAFDYFPGTIVLDGDRIVAGNANAKIVSKGSPEGLAVSYAYAGGATFTTNELPRDNVVYSPMFGASVTSINNFALVGAMFAGTAGQLQAYRYTNGDWLPAGMLSANGLQDGDQFGISMATDGSTLVVGASEAARSPASAGALYVFAYPPSDRLFGDGYDD